MVAILFSSSRITSRRLQMAERIGTNPDVGPRRRNHQRLDSSQHLHVQNRATVDVDIAESFIAANATNAWHPQVVDMTKTGDLGGHRWFDRLWLNRSTANACRELTFARLLTSQ